MKKKILIAEDEKDLLVLYRKMIGDVYEIFEALNGKEAVDLYQNVKPDLVLMDIRMPVMTGDEAIKKIREFDKKANIIAVTAFSYTKEELGVPVLRKKFTKKEFLDRLEAGLNNKNRIQET